MYNNKDRETVSDFIIGFNPKIKKKYEFLLRFITDETNQLKSDKTDASGNQTAQYCRMIDT